GLDLEHRRHARPPRQRPGDAGHARARHRRARDALLPSAARRRRHGRRRRGAPARRSGPAGRGGRAQPGRRDGARGGGAARRRGGGLRSHALPVRHRPLGRGDRRPALRRARRLPRDAPGPGRGCAHGARPRRHRPPGSLDHLPDDGDRGAGRPHLPAVGRLRRDQRDGPAPRGRHVALQRPRGRRRPRRRTARRLARPPPQRRLMTTVPTCADFTSARIVDRFDDMINPPGLTNHWATAQVDHDVVAVRSLNVPPVAQGDTITGQLYLGGRLARSYGQPVATTWRPDRVERTTTIDGLEIATVTVCPPDEPAVAVRIEVRNLGDARTARLGLWLASTVTSRPRWARAELPQAPNVLRREGLAVVGTPDTDTEVSRSSFGIQLQEGDAPAASVQRLLAPAEARELAGGPRVVEVELDLAAGGTAVLGYVHAIAATEQQARDAVDRIAADGPGLDGVVAASEAAWDRRLAGLFDPDDDTFSGSMPVLETSNDALRTLYRW